MVNVGELAFAVDSRPFVLGLQRMRRELRGFAKDARDASVAFRPGGRGPGGGGGGRIGPGFSPGGGGRLPTVIPGGGFGLGGFAGLAGGFAAVAGARAAVKTAVDFESALARIGGISDETAANLDRYAQSARDAGAATRFTATEGVEALEILARRGQNFEGADNALRPLLNFAVASDQTLPRAVQSATDIATQFSVPITEIQRVVDLVTASANRAGTTVAEMAQSFKDSGVILAEYGVSIEESAALTQILADAGIRGQRAGVALRGIAANFGPEIRAQGPEAAFRQIADLPVEQLAEIFNVRQLPAAARLVRNLDEFAKKVEENSTQIDGATDRVAERINRTVEGEALQLKSTFAELALQFDDTTGLTDGLNGGLRRLNSFFRGAAGLDDNGRRLERSVDKLIDSTDDASSTIRTFSNQLGETIGGSTSLVAGSLSSSFGAFFDSVFGSGSPQKQPGASGSGASGPIPRAPTVRVTASGATQGADPAVSQYYDVVRALRQEEQSLRLSGAAREAYNATLAATSNAYPQVESGILRQVEAIRQLDRENRAFDGIARSMTNFAEDAVFAADSVEDSMERMFESIARIGLRVTALEPLEDGLRSFLGSFRDSFGTTPRQADVPGGG